MLEKIFDLKANGTSVRQELRAGLTSFMAMCYLIFVVPSMLADAGMPRESAVAAVIWVTIAITLLMGLWARFPVGVAPGLGITAFFAYYVCGPAGYSWQTGLGAVFISGVFFMLLTVTRVRQMIIDAVPMDLKYAIVVGIGAFIAFIGLKNCGIVVADPSTFVTLGPLTKPEALLALGGLALMAMLMCLRVPGSMIIGILTVTVAGVLCGVTAMPEQAFSGFSLPLPTETFMQMDLKGALHHGLISIIFTLTMVDLFDNMGVLIGLARKAGFMDEDGHIRHLDRALVTDSIGTMCSAVLGATTATSYLECAAGVAEGGRTGLTAVTIAGLFLLALFDNMGVLIGLARKAGFMDEDGHIRHLDRALVTDSIGTMCSAVLGATTATSYLECAAGVAEGGRTGLTAVTIAGLFLLALFFTPLVAMVPAYATAPVLVLVGALMMQEVVQIKFRDLSVAIPAFLTIIAMPLTFNIATGFGFGFISFVVLRVLTGRRREVSPIMYIVAICFAANFALRG